MRRRAFVLGAALAALPVGPALAQAWPARPVTVVAPSSPGSTPDTLTRLIADRLSEQLGQPFLVVNRAGAGGNVGSEAVAKAAPDGYTLLLGSIANTVNPHLIKGAGFSLDDLAPISSVAAAPDILAVHPSVPASTLPELVAWLKSKPGTAMAIPGVGTTPHLSTELFKSMTGVELTVVPYQGGGPVLQALIANQVPIGFSTSVSIMPRLKSGQLRAIGVSSASRLGAAPDVPTLREGGLKDFEVTAWFGLFAPAKTPRPVIDRLADETRKALAQPELRKRLVDLGAEPLGATPDEFAAFVRAEYARWGKVIQQSGIRVE